MTENEFVKISEEEFVAGPGRDDDDLDIDDIFGKPFRQVRQDMLAYDRAAFEPSDPAFITPSEIMSGYMFDEVSCGLALRDPEGNIVGGYFSCDLTLDEEHQGQGLGAEIVLEFYLRNGDLPTWNLDVPAYSQAGLAAHRSAWNSMISNPVLIQKKLVWIDAQSADPRENSGGEAVDFVTP